MTFDRILSKDVPLAEAAAAFHKLKFASGYEQPDETGSLEGQFEASPEEVLKLLGEMVNNEFKTMVAYQTYAESLRGTERGSIAEEFEEHAENELEHAQFLMKRMSVLGGAIQLDDIPAPPASTDPVDIIKTMIRMEQEGIAKWKVFHSMCGDNPTKYKVEEYLTTEQHHLDELWQLLPYEARASVTTGAPEANTLPAQPMAGGGPPDEGATPNPDLGQAKTANLPGVIGGVIGGGDDWIGGGFSGIAGAEGVRALGNALAHKYPGASSVIEAGYIPTALLAGMAAGKGYSSAKQGILGKKKKAAVKDWVSKAKSMVSGGAEAVKTAPTRTRGDLMTDAYEASRKFRGDGNGKMVMASADLENMTPEEKLAAFKEKLSWGFGGAVGRVGGFSGAARSAVSKVPLSKAAPSAMSLTAPIMHQGKAIPGVPQHVLEGAGMLPKSTAPIHMQPMLGHAEAGLEAAKMRGPVANAAMKAQQGLGSAVDKTKGFFGNLGSSIKSKLQGATGRMQDAYAGKTVMASAKDSSEKGKERAETNLAAKARVHEGTRGEQYGDVLGRVLGAAGGAALGAKLGPEGKKMLSGLGSAALGQHITGKAGKVLGKELDVRRTKKAGAKLAFEDALNMIAQDQAIEQAAEQNAAEYYANQARQVAAEKQQMEQQLQQAQQAAQEKDQQIQMAQQTLQSATDTSTKALMQAVQANSEAIQHRQLAADTTITMDKLRQSLRELADGGGSPGGPGDITGGAGQAQGAQEASGTSGPAGNGSSGGGVVGGDAQPGGEQAGPAGQSETPNAGQNGAPPEGANQPETRSQSPEQGQASPATESGQGSPGGGEGGQGKVSIKVGGAMDIAKGLGQAGLSMAKERGPYALAGGLLAGGAQALSNRKGPGPSQQRAEELEGQQDGSFGQAMALAKAKAQATIQGVASEHPVASTAAAALGGAITGGMVGPRMGGRLANIGKNIRELAG